MQPELLSGVQEMSVGEFAGRLESYLARSPILRNLGIRGEISGWRVQENGGVYFRLKDENAVVDCYAFANKARNFPEIKDGFGVIAVGSVGIRKKRSAYQLLVNELRLAGIGNLHRQFEDLKERFRLEGLFDARRKRPMPSYPQRIAVVTAPGGKSVEDFFTTIAQRAPHLRLELVGTRVQGDGAEIEIASAIDRASRMDVDVIVVTRGGGSYEDLFAFNREPVIRAIVRAQHPVLSAIGHEPDHLLSDDVADLACETPSNAAQYFGGLRDQALGRVKSLDQRLTLRIERIAIAAVQRSDVAQNELSRAIEKTLSQKREDLMLLERRLRDQTPQVRVSARRERLTAAVSRLHSISRYALAPASQRLAKVTASLIGANPDAPLQRGYSIVRFDGRIVRDASAVPKGARIEAQLQRGNLAARVE